MPNKLISGPERRTHPLVWLAAIICAIIAIAVIITGTVVFIGYMVIHPRVPFISVVDAHLYPIVYDVAGRLETQISIDIKAENDNAKAHASFSDVSFILSFQGVEIAKLVANPFEVRKNMSVYFHYLVRSSPIPLNTQEMEELDLSLKQDQIRFDLKGNARARWRVGLLGSVRFWCHLNCRLHFHPSNGSYANSRCSSRSK